MKKLILSLVLGVSCWVLAFNQAMAANLYVQITDLPEYKNTDTFKLSYTALQVEDKNITAQFYYHKEGDGWSALGSGLTGTTGSVETNWSYFNTDAKYFFKIDALSDGELASDETSTTIDRKTPSSPGEYSKSRIANNAYRLTWKTPNDDDFSYVAVYRSKDQNFTADGGTFVVQVAGTKDTKITWEDLGLEINRDFFYALRAMDKAGNASGVVGDGGTVTYVSTTPTSVLGAGEVKILPKEKASGSEGQILGGETEETTPTPQGDASNPLESASKTFSDTGTGQKLLLTLIVLGLLGGGYYFFKNRSNE